MFACLHKEVCNTSLSWLMFSSFYTHIIPTVDIILKHYQAYISPRVVILVLKPCKVGGTGMKFIEYKPPKSKNLR